MKKQNVATICSNLCEHTIHAPLNWALLKDGNLFCVLQDTKMDDVKRNTHAQEEGAGDDKAWRIHYQNQCHEGVCLIDHELY